MRERRREPRRRILKGGRLIYYADHAGIPCILRNISDGGARVDLEQNQPTPTHFELLVSMDGTQVRCDVAWNDGVALGVAFTAEWTQLKKPRIQSIYPTQSSGIVTQFDFGMANTTGPIQP